jgi:hypothetical protein
MEARGPYQYRYNSFYEHPIYGFPLQRSVLIYSYFSLKGPIFLYLASFACKVHGNFFSIYEFLPYQQFSWYELLSSYPSAINVTQTTGSISKKFYIADRHQERFSDT